MPSQQAKRLRLEGYVGYIKRAGMWCKNKEILALEVAIKSNASTVCGNTTVVSKSRGSLVFYYGNCIADVDTTRRRLTLFTYHVAPMRQYDHMRGVVARLNAIIRTLTDKVNVRVVDGEPMIFGKDETCKIFML